jgi:hypothetical protein
MARGKFSPRITVTMEQIRQLIIPPSPARQLGARLITADSEQSGNEADNAIDGDPATLWHTAWSGEVPRCPHELKLEFKAPITLRGFTALPRQDGNRNGWIKEYALYASTEGKKWGEPIAQGTFSRTKELKTVIFDKTANAHFVRFVALSAFDELPYASLAEFSVLTAENKSIGNPTSSTE